MYEAMYSGETQVLISPTNILHSPTKRMILLYTPPRALSGQNTCCMFFENKKAFLRHIVCFCPLEKVCGRPFHDCIVKITLHDKMPTFDRS